MRHALLPPEFSPPGGLDSGTENVLIFSISDSPGIAMPALAPGGSRRHLHPSHLQHEDLLGGFGSQFGAFFDTAVDYGRFQPVRTLSLYR